MYAWLLESHVETQVTNGLILYVACLVVSFLFLGGERLTELLKISEIIHIKLIVLDKIDKISNCLTSWDYKGNIIFMDAY